MNRLKKIFAALALAIAVAGCAEPGVGVAFKTPSATTEAAASIGDPVRDGSFEMTVVASECGKAQLGIDYLLQKAQGQFCVVTLKVRNIGNSPNVFNDTAQVAIGAEGQRYASNSVAGISASDGQPPSWLTSINPGNELSGVVVFDIPKAGRIDYFDLHDSIYSAGARVRNSP